MDFIMCFQGQEDKMMFVLGVRGYVAISLLQTFSGLLLSGVCF